MIQKLSVVLSMAPQYHIEGSVCVHANHFHCCMIVLVLSRVAPVAESHARTLAIPYTLTDPLVCTGGTFVGDYSWLHLKLVLYIVSSLGSFGIVTISKFSYKSI